MTKTTTSRFLTLLTLLMLVLTACDSGPKQNANGDDTDTTSEAQPEDLQFDRHWNDLALLLGGMPAEEGSKTVRFDTMAATANYRKQYDEVYESHKDRLLDKLRTWCKQEFPKVHADTGNVYYPLSGGDFLTIHTIYPNAKKYVFFGLEPEGRHLDASYLQGLTEQEMANAFHVQMKALDDIMDEDESFFVTRDMQKDLKRSKLTGQIPIILSFMGRLEQQVINVEPIYLQTDGTPDVLAEQPAELDPRDSTITGMRYTFRKGPGEPLQVVEYWSLDIENPKLAMYPYFMDYIASHAPTRTYFKAASYLFHWGNFSKMRETTMATSEFILQDDSGIAYRFYRDDPEHDWDLSYYGKYDKPKLDVWGGFQGDLKRIYLTNPEVKPINFGIGYTNKPHNCNLMIARQAEEGTQTYP